MPQGQNFSFVRWKKPGQSQLSSSFKYVVEWKCCLALIAQNVCRQPETEMPSHLKDSGENIC